MVRAEPIREIIISSRIQPRVIAEWSGLSERNILRIKSGSPRWVRWGTADAIATALGESLEAYLTDEELL